MATTDVPYSSGSSGSVFRLGSVTDKIGTTIFAGTPLWWWIGFGISSFFSVIFIWVLLSVALFGTGLWGINVPMVWGMGIVNLVFWIGIGHAGTFISAFLLLMRQSWRAAFSRYAEAMTLFALAVAGVFPLFHVGRPEWIFYILPYPNTFWLNPQWRSALVWDAFAITTYGLVSALFWFLDLIPDLAAMRDKSTNVYGRRFYGILSLGWRGDAGHWDRLHRTALLLAALATPLVVSVHSIVGLDFAIGNLPGWHHTIFPPYFVGGAIFSGLAMMIIVGVGLRRGLGLQNFITMDHLEKATKLMLVTSLLVAYGYSSEIFGALYKGEVHEVASLVGRMFGPYALLFWAMIAFNVVIPQLLWSKRIRRNLLWLVLICFGILAGMWLERYFIVTMSLSYSYMPATWDIFNATWIDLLTIFSPFGFFAAQLFLFIRFFPVIPIAETQAEEMAHAGSKTEFQAPGTDEATRGGSSTGMAPAPSSGD